MEATKCFNENFPEKDYSEKKTLPERRNMPVMGTNASLLKRSNNSENQKDDSEIITELVIEKFLGNTHINSEKLQNNLITCDNNSNSATTSISNRICNINDQCTKETNEEFVYNAEEFLRKALGDELCNCTSDNNDSKVNTSIGTSRISTLINSSYNSFTNNLRRHLSTYTSSLLLKDESTANNSCTSLCTLDTTVGMLIQEARIQHQIIIETSKALNICCSSKKFAMGPERIEAERILLMATYQRQLIFEELRKFQHLKSEDMRGDSYGTITISNITFPLADASLLCEKNFNQWFVVIVSCGTKVMVTDIIMPNSNEELNFQHKFEFNNLRSDFEIVIGLYSLCAKIDLKPYGKEWKFNLKENTTKCLNPQKFFHKHDKKNSGIYYSYERHDPLFKLWGTTILHKTDLNQTSGFPLDHISRNGALRGILLADVWSNVHFIINHSGFLTIKSESDKYATWNRYWCYLKGYILSYWNYPTDQDMQVPIGTINLRCCISPTVSLVSRELCARSKTLLLETVQTEMSTGSFITRHYLSADSLQDLDAWKKHLNSMLVSLKCWNMMKCEVHVAEISTTF